MEANQAQSDYMENGAYSVLTVLLSAFLRLHGDVKSAAGGRLGKEQSKHGTVV